MYYEQSLMSPSYILKLSLWLLFGCSILGNDLYANENNQANIGKHINNFFGKKKGLKKEILSCHKSKKQIRSS